MDRFGQWQVVRELGAGGQGTAYLAIDSTKVDTAKMLERTRWLVNELAASGTAEQNRARAAEFLALIETYSRREIGENVAVVKVLHEKARQDAKSLERLEREIEVLRSIDHPAIIKILDALPREGWFVTPYYPGGALSERIGRYTGEPLLALRSLRPLIEGVAELHRRRAVHRDIKPDNIFVNREQLVLGDFGIVWIDQDGKPRLSETYENVGSRDWMPGWAMGMRVDGDVPPAFDVFGLGKVLWAMVGGRTKVPLWYWNKPEFSIIDQFPYDPRMRWINRILAGSVVEDRDKSWSDAEEMLRQVDQVIVQIRNGGQVINRDVPRVCTVCGGATYELLLDEASPPASLRNVGLNPTGHQYRIYSCPNCGHIQWFRMERNPPAWGELR